MMCSGCDQFPFGCGSPTCLTGQENLQPPYSNTGAQNTLQNAVLLDWCGFTVPTQKFAFSCLGIDENAFSDLEKGGLGYSKSKVFGHIRIYSEGTIEMGCHVEMSGQACREYESQKKPWWELAADVFQCGGKFTRIDLALDDYQNKLKLVTMEAKVRRGAIRSVFKKARSIKEYKLEDGSFTGKTIYFGSATSRVQIRIYDKSLEQKNKPEKQNSPDKADSERSEPACMSASPKTIPDHWIRVEMQCRDERAQAIAQYLIFDEGLDIGVLYKKFLTHYLSFLIRKTDTNKFRWPVCDWWLEFLDSLEGLPLTICPRPRTIDTISRWVMMQVAPSLALLSVDENGKLSDLTHVVNITSSGVSRLKQKDLEIVKTYNYQRKLKKEQLNKIAEKKEPVKVQ